MGNVIFSGKLLWPDGGIRPGIVVVEGNRISRVEESVSTPNVYGTGVEIIQVPEGGVIAPGFIDLHLNGAFGHDFTSNPRQISAVALNLPRFGITSFLPALVSLPLAEYTLAIEMVRDIRERPEMAAVLGLHLEGPYLNRAKASSHQIRNLRSPDKDELLYFDPAVVRCITVAPELPGAIPFIRAISERGIVVALGHSTATYDETLTAVSAGASWAAHIFNGMGSLHHRHPGIVGALLTDERIRVSLVADKIHVHPALMALVAVAKGEKGVTLISKALSAAGMPKGNYNLGAQMIQSSSVGARLPNGTLAGSLEMLDQGVRNMVTGAGRPLEEVLQMTSQTPADLLGLKDRGKLAPNYLADIIVLDDQQRVNLTMVRGNIIYRQTTP